MIRWNGNVGYAGRTIIARVTPLRDGTDAADWSLVDVAISQKPPATVGRCSSVIGAKRAVQRAWSFWLRERGLAEVS